MTFQPHVDKCFISSKSLIAAQSHLHKSPSTASYHSTLAGVTHHPSLRLRNDSRLCDRDLVEDYSHHPATLAPMPDGHGDSSVGLVIRNIVLPRLSRARFPIV